MTDLKLKLDTADLTAWKQLAMKPDDKLCYNYLLIYADDTHVVTHKVRNMMENLCVLFCLQKNQNNGKHIDTTD